MSKKKLNFKNISKIFSVLATTTILSQAVLSPIAVFADEAPKIQQSELEKQESSEEVGKETTSDVKNSDLTPKEPVKNEEPVVEFTEPVPSTIKIEDKVVGNVPLGYLPAANFSLGVSDTGKTILTSKSTFSARSTGNSSGMATAYYGGYATSTSYITIDGEVAYCIDPALGFPINIDYRQSVMTDLGVYSIMYYANPTTEKGYVDAYVALNYYLGHFNSPAMAADPGVATLLAHAYAQDAPNGSFDISNKVQTANWNNSSSRQETGWYQTSYTGSNQHYTITVPNGVTAVLSDGRSLGAGTHNIDVSVSFKLTAGPAYDGTVSFDVPTNVKVQSALLFTPTSGNTQRLVSPGYNTDPISITGIKATFKAQLGNIKVDKKDSESGTPIPGTSYKVVNSAGAQVATGKTAADGSLLVKDLLFGDYQVIETGAAYGFTINVTPKSATVKPAETTTVSFVNDAVKGKLEVQKVDADTGLPTAQGDATLNGAVYGVYNKAGTLLDTLTFNGTSLITKELDMPGGDLEGYLQEITAPTGYNLNPDKIPFMIKYKDQDTRVVQINVTAEDKVIRGTVSIQKFFAADDTTSSLLFPEVGAEFTATLVSNGVEADRQTTGIDGKIEFKNLVYGKYVIKQTKTPPGKIKVGDFEVDVYENGRTYYYNIVNQNFKSLLKIRKIDFDTKKNILKAGIPFKVKNLDTGEFVIHNVFYPTPVKYDVFETNEDGELVLPQMLDYNEKGYELYEMSAPDGYVLDKKPLKFFVNEESLVGDMITISFENKAQVSKLTVTKTGETLTSASKEKTDFGMKYTPEFTQAPLAGVKVHVEPAADIKTADGTIRYKKGDKIAYGVTNEKGQVVTNEKTDPLYPGNYVLVEDEAPAGYVIAAPKPFKVKYAGENVEVSATSATLENDLQELLVKIYKTEGVITGWENGEAIVEQQAASDKVFGIFTDQPFTFNSKELIPTDGLIALATTKEGAAGFQAKFPEGKFYIMELDAGSNHVLDETKYAFEVKRENNEKVFEIGIYKDSVAYGKQNLLKIARNSITNELARAAVELVKIDALDGKALEGVGFDLIHTDKEAVETVIGSYKTDKEGKISVENLPTGNYKFVETKPLNWYEASKKDLSFVVSPENDGEVIKLTAVNKRKPLEITTLFATTKDDHKQINPAIDNDLTDTGEIKGLKKDHTYYGDTFYMNSKNEVVSQSEMVITGDGTEAQGFKTSLFLPKNTLKDGEILAAKHVLYSDKEKQKEVGRHNEDLKDKKQMVEAKTPKVGIQTQTHTGDGKTQTYTRGDIINAYDNVKITHTDVLDGTKRAFQAILVAVIPDKNGKTVERDIWTSEIIDYIVNDEVFAKTVVTKVDTGAYPEGTTFFFKEVGLNEVKEKDTDHNLDGKDRNQALTPVKKPLPLPQTGEDETTFILMGVFLVGMVLVGFVVRNNRQKKEKQTLLENVQLYGYGGKESIFTENDNQAECEAATKEVQSIIEKNSKVEFMDEGKVIRLLEKIGYFGPQIKTEPLNT